MTDPLATQADATRRARRAALYYRLHALRAWLARPFVLPLLRGLAWTIFVLWLLFVAAVLALRFVILPGVADYRGEIEQAASRAIGQAVRIGQITARWDGLNPDLVLDQVSVLDAGGEPSFTLERVESILSWQSLWRGQPILSLLAFERPVLHVRRDAAGRISVAGIPAAGEGDTSLMQWLLEQRRIRIRDATIVWEDESRQAPPLLLEDLQFGLDNLGRVHRFGLSAAPPAELAARIDLRGEVRGDLHDALEDFAGKLYLELAYADLAGWRAWIDYPLELPYGRGALRVWGDLADGAGKLTADLALEALKMQLASQLPPLELASLHGRLSAAYQQDRWTLAGERVELLTADGTRLLPGAFHIEQQREQGVLAGSARIETLDLAALAHLAAHLPLDARSRELLARHAPQGQVSGLRLTWGLAGEKLLRYALTARFAGLGVVADSYFPGAQGLAGSVDLSERGGVLLLDSGPSSLSLPAVFPEPEIAFDRIRARTRWENSDAGLAVNIEKLDFVSPDATGSAHGTYRYSGSGPGVIDLDARIDKADGRAVWRYMPSVVNREARDWLRRGIVAGTAHDGHLVLRGDLANFPFRDPATGEFRVTARARDVRIDYAAGWPIIDQVDADMHFDYGMKIHATRGRILGAALADVNVLIPDFDVSDEMLLVRGKAQGPTGEFLKFIDASPVAASIDHFTDGMRATGNGRLDLELDIPLRRAEQTRVRGNYQFQNNQVHVVDGLPMLTDVNGRLDLSENSVAASGITGRGFGGPLRVQVNSAAGKVGVVASGTANIAEVSRHFAWPLLDRLAGSTPWQADISIQRRNASVVVTSDLLGIRSPLPEPFAKTAEMRLPLRVERTAPSATSEQYRVSLGNLAQAQIVRRDGRWTQGALALGDAELRLPERGLAVRASLARIDTDAWRSYLPAESASAPAAAGGEPGDGLALAAIHLKTPLLTLLGRTYSDVAVGLRPRDAGWQIALETREAAGNLYWRGAGDGWVEGRLQRLHLAAGSVGTSGTSGDSVLDTLPGMNIAVDDLRLDKKQFGNLDLRARNQGGNWLLERLRLRNPDGELTGTGRWTRTGRQQTQLEFALTASDIGKLLTRLGYDDAVRQGQARLDGNLRWNGALTALDYPSLSGELRVKADKGQFNKLEPGVGRLLGLISLQSLPRRLTLDFRDLFSEGLAFDSIEGRLVVDAGTMRTVDGLNINGPAVQVVIDGHTDLEQETQDLRVLVRPEVGGLAAVGAATLVNPVAGAATLVANTLLQKPLNRLFSYRYHVTGTWDDPQVNKAGESQESLPPAAQEKQP